MVDRIELIEFDQPKQVRKLKRENAVWLQQNLEAFHKIVQVGHLRQNIVAGDKVGVAAFGGKVLSHFMPKKRTSVGTPFFTAASATFAAGSMPRTGMPMRTKYCSR